MTGLGLNMTALLNAGGAILNVNSSVNSPGKSQKAYDTSDPIQATVNSGMATLAIIITAFTFSMLLKKTK